ncbi:MAG: VWA domain-containing protein [Solirubrobacteraceae bacterium]
MSFASPLWLAALGLVPLALSAQAWTAHRTKRFAVRFPAVATVKLAMVPGPDLRRRLPAALALVAIVALVLTLSGPHISYSAPVGNAAVMLVTDHSGSMAATDVTPSRLLAAENAADSFIGRLPATVRVGAIAFGSSPDGVQGPLSDHGAARAIIDGQSPGGATATGDALELALELLHASSPQHPPSAIVLLSDGAANAGVDVLTVAAQAGREGVPIYTVALGTPGGMLSNPDPLGAPVPVAPDPQLMAQIAQRSRGRAFDAQSEDQLNSIYGHLSSQLGTVTRKRDVAAEFALGGLVALIVAAIGATRWTARLP